MAAGNFVNGEIDLAARADFIEKVRQSLLPPNGDTGNRILLGQVLKAAPLVGEALLYKAPNSKSADLTGTPGESACTREALTSRKQDLREAMHRSRNGRLQLGMSLH